MTRALPLFATSLGVLLALSCATDRSPTPHGGVGGESDEAGGGEGEGEAAGEGEGEAAGEGEGEAAGEGEGEAAGEGEGEGEGEASGGACDEDPGCEAFFKHCEVCDWICVPADEVRHDCRNLCPNEDNRGDPPVCACEDGVCEVVEEGGGEDDWYACGDDRECVTFEAECCDHCNGGRSIAVNEEFVRQAQAALAPDPAECQGIMCTEMACPESRAECVGGRCQLVGANGGGGLGAVCGTRGAQPCAEPLFCKWQPEAQCGRADQPGECAQRPGICQRDCPRVCGCDGQTYCNACGAWTAGISVDHDGPCAGDGGGAAGGPPPEPRDR